MSILLLIKKCCCNKKKCYYQLLPCDNQAPDGPGPLCPTGNIDCCDHTPDPIDKRYIVLCDVAETLNSQLIDMNPWCVPLLTLDPDDGTTATNCYCWDPDNPIVDKDPNTDTEVTAEDLKEIYDDCPACCCDSNFCTGACCQGESCTEKTRAECITTGGNFLGEGSICFPQTGNPCVFDCTTCASSYTVNVVANVTTIANQPGGCQSVHQHTLSTTIAVIKNNPNLCQWAGACAPDTCAVINPNCAGGGMVSMSGRCMASSCVDDNTGCGLGQSICHSAYMITGACQDIILEKPQPSAAGIQISFNAGAGGGVVSPCSHCGDICAEFPLFAISATMLGPRSGCPTGAWVWTTPNNNIFTNSNGTAILDNVSLTVG